MVAGGKNVAVFLDRDGTIIEDNGHLSDLSKVVFFEKTVEALQRLSKHFLLFIVTNQPGVARGLLSVEDVDRVNAGIVRELSNAGVEITDTYVCPHERVDNCACIKPNSHFVRKAAKDYNIDAERSFVVGDHPCDVQMARNSGTRGIYVLTGHGGKHVDELGEDTEIVYGIMEATERILSYHAGVTKGSL